jgi:hypothetical protein
MTARIDALIDLRRSSSEGRAYVYVLPLRTDEVLKLGFSRDPVVRMRSLHRRYFDFFDVERALIVETDRVREARAVERDLKRRIHEHRAQVPIEVRPQAGGETEWYRGAYAPLREAARELVQRGYRVHVDARPWLRERLLARSALLFDWSAQVYEQMQIARSEPELIMRAAMASALRDELDALAAFDIDFAGAVPGEVGAWYRRSGGD